jgi:SAM-dependent methyltransferase
VTRIRVARPLLEIPSELHFLMAGARRIALVEKNGYFYLWPYGYDFIAGSLTALIQTRLGWPRRPALADFVELRSAAAVYRARPTSAPLPAEGEYGVVNKLTNFMLMPLADVRASAAAATERFWASLENYHEHLSVDQQRGFAHQISGWFAEEILAPLGVSSVLEIGCGSGRNLVHIARTLPSARLVGLDVNPHAVRFAVDALAGRAEVRQTSLYALGDFADGSIDVVFSMGVLMHVSHERVVGVVAEMLRIARTAVIHFECHGPSYGFDYHKYPRDYADLYRRVALAATTEYEVYQQDDFRSREAVPFHMALLVGRK